MSLDGLVTCVSLSATTEVVPLGKTPGLNDPNSFSTGRFGCRIATTSNAGER